MDVKFKDRKTEVEYLRMACNLAELNIDYLHADLILKIQDSLNKLKGEFSISDGVEIRHKWEEDWKKYFKEQSENKKQ